HAAVITRLSILLIFPLIPGMLGAALMGYYSPCGPNPADGSHEIFLYSTMWCNAVFYSGTAFVTVRLWINRKIKRLRNINAAALQASTRPDIAFNRIGSLLKYERSSS